MALAPDDAEMEKIAEDELAKLQRQFRIMEIERAAVSGNVRPTLRVQRNLLQILNRELETIMLELKLMRSPSNLAESSKVRDKLASMLGEYDRVSSAVKLERGQVQEIDFLLRQVQREIKTLEAKGSRSEEDYAKTITNYTMVSQLENRLDNAVKRFNSINTHNLRMRQEIDRLLQDRQSFNIVWKNQVKQLMDGKTQILELVEQAIVTYDQREEWCAKLEDLKNKAAIDYRKHCLDVRDLQRQLDHSMKLEDFLRTKGTLRVTAADAKAEAKRLEQLEREQQIYNNYVNILEAIKEFTGESDVDKIIQEFNRREEENYALFNYVNEINSELKLIHDNVKTLRSNLDEEREKHEARAEQQKDSIENLQQTLDGHRQQSCTLQLENQKSKDTLDRLLISIHELAVCSQCESLPLVKLLGKSTKINVSNVRLYLRSIEMKIFELADVIRADEVLRRQAEAKEKTPPSTRRKSNMPRTPRRSPRERVVVAAAPKGQEKMLLAAP